MVQYNGPFNEADGASFVNGDPSIGRMGSIPPAEAFEFPQRDVVNFIKDNSLLPSNADLHQFSRGLQNSSVIYAVDRGTANAMVITLSPVPQTLTPGMTIRIKKSSTPNTGPVTLNIGVGTHALLKAEGSNFLAGEFPGNMVFEAIWDGSAWKAIYFLGLQSTVQNVNNFFTTHIPYCADTSVVANAITAPFAPAITQLVAGNLVLVKLANAFTGGAVTINVNALPVVNVKRGDGANPIAGDGYVGQLLLLEHDGTFFQIINSVAPRAPMPLILADQKSSGTEGGTFTTGAWRTRDLNTVLADPFGLVGLGLVSIASNRMTLASGKWRIVARLPFASKASGVLGIMDTQARLYNITDSVVALKGTYHAQKFESFSETSYAYVEGEVTLTSTKTFEFQQICGSSVGHQFDFGIVPSSITIEPIWNYAAIGNPGPETYMVVNLWRVS